MTSNDRLSIQPYLKLFNEKYKDKYTVFVIMRFADSYLLKFLYSTIKDELAKQDIVVIRADENRFASQLWTNIEVHLMGANAGIAIFDNISVGGTLQGGFNPNVGIEAGYMIGLDKPLMILKDKNLSSMPTDFLGRLYYSFNGDDPLSVTKEIKLWGETLIKSIS